MHEKARNPGRRPDVYARVLDGHGSGIYSNEMRFCSAGALSFASGSGLQQCGADNGASKSNHSPPTTHLHLHPVCLTKKKGTAISDLFEHAHFTASCTWHVFNVVGATATIHFHPRIGKLIILWPLAPLRRFSSRATSGRTVATQGIA